MFCHPIRTFLVSSVVVLALTGFAFADVVRTLTMEGSAELAGVSRSLARSKALEAAQKNAVFDIATRHMDPATVQENQALLNTAFMENLANYVGSYKIIDQTLSATHITVKISADVNESAIIQDLKEKGLLRVQESGKKGEIQVVVGQPEKYRTLVEFRKALAENVEGVEQVLTSSISRKEVVLTLTLKSKTDIEQIKKGIEMITVDQKAPKVSQVENDRLQVQF